MPAPERIDERRLEILAEPAVWGHRIGAPATEAEVRAMAAELLELRAWLEESLGSIPRPDEELDDHHNPEPDPGGLY